MKQELEIQLQSYVDGELSGREARRVADWIAKDAEAQALVAELKMTRSALRGNELVVTLSENREFYWRGIEHAIESAGSVATKPAARFWMQWRNYLAPVAGVALLAILALSTARFYDLTGSDDSTRHLAEVENLSEHTSAYSFRSHSENMFVVWVHDRNLDALPESDPEEDLIIQ